jgi:hypothetical protein
MPDRDHQAADLVDDQQLRSAQIADALGELTVALGLGEPGDDVGEGGEVDGPARLHRLDGEGRGQMGLAGAGRAEKMHHLGAVDEAQLGERHDALPVERRLEGEVETGEGLDGGEARQRERHLDAPVLAHGALFDEQLIERFDAVDLALLDAPQRGVEHLQGARHPERHQAVPDAVDGGRRGVRDHGRPPATARRSPIA